MIGNPTKYRKDRYSLQQINFNRGHTPQQQGDDAELKKRARRKSQKLARKKQR